MLVHSNFRRGGGGVQVSLTTFFFSPQLILQESNGQLKENFHFSRFERGSNIFQGVQLFPGGGGGSNCLFPFETHITCDFPGAGGGSGPPVPLWIRTCSFKA